MPSRVRLHVRLTATALLVSLAMLGAPHSFDPHHDTDWQLGAYPHDESAHKFAARDGDQGSHPLHCLACHWARSFRPRIAAATIPAHNSRSARFVAPETPAASSSHSAVQPPLRAPPLVRNGVNA